MSTAMMFMAVCMNLSLIILSLIWDLLPIGYLDKNEKFKNKNNQKMNANQIIFKIAFLDHAGEDVYQFKDADLVVTVGDDTTLIASDILYRFNIPIVGITDGDLDKVVEDGFKAKNSIIFEFESGTDDVVGRKIFELIFKKEKILVKSRNSKNIDEIRDEIIKITNLLNCKYNIINI